MISTLNWVDSFVRRTALLSLIFLIPILLFVTTTQSASAQATVINFDQDAAGADIPDGETIDNEYAALGVTFAGSYSVCRTATCRPDLPENTSLNMLCTFALGGPPVGACTPPIGGNAAIVVDVATAVDFVSIEGYTSTGQQDSDAILMQAFNAAGVIVGEIRATCDNGNAPYATAGVCNPSISGVGITRVFITPITPIDGFDNLVLGSGAPVAPTAVPPTAVPPTAVPPTAVPPTAVPPTAVPPTAVPPTAVPPTAIPPTAIPPTAVPVVPTPTALPSQPDPEADLAVTQADSADPVNQGDTFIYTLNVVNNGPGEAANVKLIDTLPAQVTILSAVPSQGSCSDGTSGVITCTLGNIANGGTATVVIQAEVNADAAGSLINSVAVSTETIDPDAANNQATENTVVGTAATSADLAITNSGAPNPVSPGDELSFTLAVTNQGPDGASGVTVTDALPPEVSFVSADSADAACSEATNIVTCTVGDMANGATASIVIVTKVNADASGTFTNMAVAASDTADADQSNNQDMADTTVMASPGSADLSVTASGAPAVVKPGNELVYTMEVASSGPDMAAAAQLTNELSAGTTFMSATSDDCGHASGMVTCALGDLSSGASVSIEITVMVNDDAEGPFISVMAEVTSGTSDPDASNNKVNVQTEIEPLAIDLAQFVVEADTNGITVNWETGSEIDAEGFNIHRSNAVNGDYIQVNGSLIAATGDSDAGSSYSFTDSSADPAGSYYYKLEEIDSAANSVFHDPISINAYDIDLFLPLLFK